MKPKTISRSQNAIPFISYINQKFVFNPEAEEFLLSIPEEKKVAAISIVGKYRTGKSFFINRVLLETKKSGFAVGPTVNPCTKGLWIWKKTLPSKNPQYPDMETIVIDTEGFGGIDETNNHDSRIFLFSLLLSSFFIYNSVGSIDENALNSLNLIINLAASIQKKSGNKYDTSLYPTFLWIVRDFTLQLVDKQNQKLTPSQYLENALQIQQGTSPGVINKNKIREEFTKVFTDRDCMTMVIPVDKDTSLQRLDELDNTHLRPQFLSQVQDVKKRIFTKLRPKYADNKQLNGHMFVEVIKGYIEIMNSGQLPTIQNTFVYIRRSECMKAVSQSIRKLEGIIENQLTNNGLLDEKQVIQFRTSLQNDIMTFFRQKLLSHEEPDQQALNHLKRKMNELMEEFVERNKKSWQNRYRQLSEKGIGELRDKIFREEYQDYNEFIEDFNRMKQQFESETGNNPEKWSHFNLMAESLHRLAGETIIAKIANSTKVENEILQKKIKLREDQLSNKKKEYDDEKTYLKTRIEELERQVSKTSTSEGVKDQTIKHLKQDNTRLKQKSLGLEEAVRDKEMEIGRINAEGKKVAIEVEQTKSEFRIMKSNIEKQKTLHEMEKEHHEKQIQSYKEKVALYEGENKRLKNNNNILSNQNDDYKSRLEEKQQKEIENEQLIEAYKLKIQNLVVEGNKTSEMVNDYNDWMVEKKYLQGQVSFLKNSIHENKKLHDALLVALQQSVSTVDGNGSDSLVETNKNLLVSLEKLEARCRLLEQKSEKLKRFKKIVKNCTALQCLHCLKWVANAVFPQHLVSCASESPQLSKGNLKENTCIIDLAGFHLSINQAVIKQIEQKRPFTQFLIQITYHQKKWTVNQKSKSFGDLYRILLQTFPSVKLPECENVIINPNTDINEVINSKKTIAVQQKRKDLQQFMRDLSKIDVIRNSDIFREFIKFDENNIGIEEEIENLPKSSEKMYTRQVASSMGLTKKQTKTVNGSYTGLKTRKH